MYYRYIHLWPWGKNGTEGRERERQVCKQKKRKMALGKKRKVRDGDDPLVHILKAVRSVGPNSQSLAQQWCYLFIYFYFIFVMMLLTAKNQSIWQGNRTDTWQVEERQAGNVAPGPNENSLTGRERERFKVSTEPSHFEIWGGDSKAVFCKN